VELVRTIASLGVGLFLAAQLLAGCAFRAPLHPLNSLTPARVARTLTDVSTPPASSLNTPPFPADAGTTSEPASTPSPASSTAPIGASITPNPPASTPRPPTVFLDPGHGGVDTGTIGTTIDGTTLFEKTIALTIAQRTATQLRQAGISVVLYRTDDSLPGMSPTDYTGDQTALSPDGVLANLQQRIDRANASGAAALLSIHLNSFDDPAIRGSETVYDPDRPFAAQSQRLAQLVQSNLVGELQGHGYDTPDRGVAADTDLVAERFGTLGGDYHNLVLLGPGIAGRLRPSNMPGALCEVLFLSNPTEASAATRDDVQDLAATGFSRAIEQYLQGATAPA
jgi:N-acetylmuramoyl-L-alanine amidase